MRAAVDSTGGWQPYLDRLAALLSSEPASVSS